MTGKGWLHFAFEDIVCVGCTVLFVFSQIGLGQGDQTALPDDTEVRTIPVTERFCAPIRSTFVESEMTTVYVRGKRIRQKRNGGYGLAVSDKIGKRNLIHVGADLGWQQVGEPVFAVAD